MTEDFEQQITSALQRELAPADALHPDPGEARYQVARIEGRRVPVVARILAAVAPLATLKVGVALAATGAVVAGTGAAVHIAAEHHIIKVPSGVPFIAPAAPSTNVPSSNTNSGNGANAKETDPHHQEKADQAAPKGDESKKGIGTTGKGDASKDHHATDDSTHHATPSPEPSHDPEHHQDHR